jgi:hypothetical protein
VTYEHDGIYKSYEIQGIMAKNLLYSKSLNISLAKNSISSKLAWPEKGFISFWVRMTDTMSQQTAKTRAQDIFSYRRTLHYLLESNVQAPNKWIN